MQRQFLFQIDGDKRAIATWLISLTRQLAQNSPEVEYVPCVVRYIVNEDRRVPQPEDFVLVRVELRRRQDCPKDPQHGNKGQFHFVLLQPDRRSDRISLRIDYDQGAESEFPELRGYLGDYLAAITDQWPSVLKQMKKQVAALGDPGFTEELLSSEAESSQTGGDAPAPQRLPGWTPEVRRRADLFRRVREDHPNVTQSVLARLAQDRATEQIKKEIKSEHPAWKSIDKEVNDRMMEMYGKAYFTRDDVKYAWGKMSKAGEVEEWNKAKKTGN